MVYKAQLGSGLLQSRGKDLRHQGIGFFALLLTLFCSLVNAQTAHDAVQDAAKHTATGAEGRSVNEFSMPKFVSKVVAISELSITLQGVSGWVVELTLPMTQNNSLTVDTLGPWSSTFEDATAKRLQIGDLFVFTQYTPLGNNQTKITYYTVKQDVINRWRASVVETSGVDPIALPPFFPHDAASPPTYDAAAQQSPTPSRAANLLNGISSAMSDAAAQQQSTRNPIEDALKNGLSQTEAIRAQAGAAGKRNP